MGDEDTQAVIGCTANWVEQTDGTYSLIVTIQCEKTCETTVIQQDVSKKELFELRLKGEENWVLNETTLTTGNY